MGKISLIGYLAMDDYEYYFYKNENGEICKEDGTLYDDEISKMFVLWANSPWANTYDNYYIEHVIHDVKPYYGPFWKCIHEVIGYDGITTQIYGYGNEPNEALNLCMITEQHLQKKYNPDGNKV